MNACPARIQQLDCDKSGKSFLRAPWLGGNRIPLIINDGAQFPDITLAEGHFFVDIKDSCGGHCATIKVTGKEGDDLIVEPLQEPACFSSNSKVTYHTGAQFIQAIVREVGINAQTPLFYDCKTHTIGIDCHELANNPDCGCGTSGTNNIGAGTVGPQGPSGAPGRDGTGIRSVRLGPNNELYVTLTNGQEIEAGVIGTIAGRDGVDGRPGRDGINGRTPDVREIERLWMEDAGNGTYNIKVSYTGDFSGVGQLVGTFDVPAIRSTLPEEIDAIRNSIGGAQAQVNGLRGEIEQLRANNAALQNEVSQLRTQVAQLQSAVNSLQQTVNAINSRPWFPNNPNPPDSASPGP